MDPEKKIRPAMTNSTINKVLAARLKAVWRRQQVLHQTGGLLAFCRWGLGLFLVGMAAEPGFASWTAVTSRLSSPPWCFSTCSAAREASNARSWPQPARQAL
jgi:hypothetical protein